MNEFDTQACFEIQKYYVKNGQYPEYIEATPEFYAQLSCLLFHFLELEASESHIHRIGPPTYKENSVPVYLIKE